MWHCILDTSGSHWSLYVWESFFPCAWKFLGEENWRKEGREECCYHYPCKHPGLGWILKDVSQANRKSLFLFCLLTYVLAPRWTHGWLGESWHQLPHKDMKHDTGHVFIHLKLAGWNAKYHSFLWRRTPATSWFPTLWLGFLVEVCVGLMISQEMAPCDSEKFT